MSQSHRGGNAGAGVGVLACPQARPLLTFCTRSALPPTQRYGFSCALVGDNAGKRSMTSASRSRAHRPKGITHRLCKSVVPQNSGRRVVVLAAVDDDHHREGQGLQRHRTRAEHPRRHVLPLLFSVPITACSLFQFPCMSPWGPE